MSTNGSAPSSNERLAQRLSSISAALREREKPKAPAGLTEEVLRALARGLIPFLNEFVAEALAPLIARLAVSEQRVAELEARPTMKYEGVWKVEKAYSLGDFCTEGGSMWHCNRPCVGVRPGDPGGVWTLAIQRGKSAR